MKLHAHAVHMTILYDGRPGHLAASKGVLRSFERVTETRHTLVNIRLRLKFTRPLLRALLNRRRFSSLSTRFQQKLIQLFYKIDGDLPSIGQADWCLSTGGDTSFLNAWLGQLYGRKNIYCSSLRGLDPTLFTWLISARTTPPGPNEIRLSVIPVPVDREETRQKGKTFRAEKQLGDTPLWAVLIGGDGLGYRFSMTSYQQLADGLTALAEKHQARLLITTSRRTGAVAENVLKERLAGHPTVAHLTLYGQNPEKVVAAFTGAADMIFCTADSGSMISESVAMGVPVYALADRDHIPSPLQPLLQKNMDQKRVSLRFIDELQKLDLDGNDRDCFCLLETDPVSELADKIKHTIRNLS